MPERVRYRKLPGHRRGLFRGASVWLGPDHLLLVRSMRFREEYKRYQFRDIQAIVVAGTKRFHISTRALAIALLWLITSLALWNRAAWGPAFGWTSALLLIAAWMCVSGFFSCRCRIYTAVSRDDLPSVYRTWTARRFLREVEPLIAAVQGRVEGWAQAVETRDIGPAAPRPESTGVPPPPRPAPPRRTRTLASDFLIACLFADAVWNTVNMNTARLLHGAGQGLALALTCGAILVVVQHHRGTIGRGMQRLAIAVLVAVGVLYYLRPIAVGIIAGAAANVGRQRISVATVLAAAPWMRTVEAVAASLLGLAGLGIVLFGGEDR